MLSVACRGLPSVGRGPSRWGSLEGEGGSVGDAGLDDAGGETSDDDYAGAYGDD